jgi:hypothetical protein
VPATALHIADVTISTGNWGTLTDKRGLLSSKPIVAGSGVTVTDSLGEATIAADAAVVAFLAGSTYTGTHDFTGATVTGVGNGYTLLFVSNTDSPADATTYYFGAWAAAAASTNAAAQRVYVPKTGTLKAVYGYVYVGGASGTGESNSLYLRKNNTTDTTITTSLATNGAVENPFNATGLSTAVTAGDYLEMKWTTPTWATNPTNVRVHVVAYIE